MAQRLRDVDPDQEVCTDGGVALTKAEAEARLAQAQARMVEASLRAAGLLDGAGRGPGRPTPPGPAVLAIFEGWDASGKGGAIRRLTAPLDPRHYRVAVFGVPTAQDLTHHFLQRFFGELPPRGRLCVFDRSWYGRVLVERVEGLVERPVYERAYAEIVDFERLLAAEGTVIVKFWMHVSPKEQLRRFNERAADPMKAWKLTDDDWRNRERWDDYVEAVDEMLARTDHPAAPWTVVPANHKRSGRIVVLETVLAAMEAAGGPA